ncbi:response regulator [Pseudobacteriovorax antillogorgiicola]|uniref:Response regulator receiver domain-containing protein n=1 Tax=Pseudobacteriovorax antillogorgiicola TaxID=1513793 RepID=A0A1Y6CG38_9BACT|nr:response regulator [Pseudobacteriovorax antillogorgiicola]TCS47262.1 response regulator receiver domain-containing protein [Pseudobacteriovorax antillogorgiicola]SMF62116.1 Response regulator receiver domain-containing protein [Pseudobacteriovorax antillogorgiicola]
MLKSALIVDDDPGILALISEIISQHGFLSAGVSRGEDALDYGRELHEMDVVFTDLRMPGMDGFELTATLRKRGISCPIIAITGLPDKGQSLYHSNDGKARERPDMILPKPFGLGQMEQVLAYLNHIESPVAKQAAMQLDLGF